MKKVLIAALAVSALAMLPAEAVVQVEPTVSVQVKRRKMNKTANKIKVFYGYASDRKGKGQKKREASARRKRGW